MSLEQTEAECAANATAPRVSLADIEATIALRVDVTGWEAAKARGEEPAWDNETWPEVAIQSLPLLSICLLVMRNGFTVIGKSAPASPDNFNAELGKKLAYEDAVRQIWPLMGWALRDRILDASQFASTGPR